MAIYSNSVISKDKLLIISGQIPDACYLPSVREVFKKVLDNIKSAMTLVVISELVNPKFKIEIDATVDYN